MLARFLTWQSGEFFEGRKIIELVDSINSQLIYTCNKIPTYGLSFSNTTLVRVLFLPPSLLTPLIFTK